MKPVLFLTACLALAAAGCGSDDGSRAAGEAHDTGSRPVDSEEPMSETDPASQAGRPEGTADSGTGEKAEGGHAEGGASDSHGGHHPSDETDDATTHHSFGDVERWIEVFDDPGRKDWQKPEEVVEALGLKPGMNVADIGAGTGYFNPYLARAVGPEGKVYASDLEPSLVEHMKARAVKEKTPNVEVIQADTDDPHLPPGQIDLILIVNTYHHFDDRLKYFPELKQAFRPGGRLVIVDFLKKELPIGPGVDHKLTSGQVTSELEAAGYRLAEKLDFLPYQYFLIFEQG